MSEKTVRVRVIDRWRVVHDDKPYVKGDTVTVPESVAHEWERNRYVERVTRQDLTDALGVAWRQPPARF